MPSEEENQVSASEAKLHFGEILNQCVYGGKPVYIKKHDKPVAVLVSIDSWKQSRPQTQKEHPLLKEFEKLWEMAANRKAPPKELTNAYLLKESRKEREKQLLKNLKNR